MATSRRGKRGSVSSSSSRSDNKVTGNSTSAETSSHLSPTTNEPTPLTFTNKNSKQSEILAPHKFSSILWISLALTHIVDLSKSLSVAHYAFQHGVASPESISTLPINATAYCVRNFHNLTEIKADLNNADEVVAELGCTASDLSILNVKHQTSILRVGLSIVTSILCWGDEPLFKAWNCTYCIFLFLMLACLRLQSTILKGTEKFSCLLTIAFLLSSNRRGGQNRLHLVMKEGLFNLVLFFLVVFMAYVISIHLKCDVEDLTYLDTDNVTPGGRATWFMTVTVEYSILIIVSAFALFYFDEGRKRALLAVMSIFTIYHAFIQLPSQENFWADASSRQSYIMIVFILMLVGAIVPSFDKFIIKR